MQQKLPGVTKIYLTEAVKLRTLIKACLSKQITLGKYENNAKPAI